MDIKLIIGNKNYSSWSLRAWLLLRESNIDFSEHRIALDTPTAKAELAAASPAARVPVLMLGDEMIWDSLAIAETVAERWPEAALWPEDRQARAHARAVSAEMHSGFDTLRAQMPMNCRAMGRQIAISDELAKDIDRIIAIWSECHHRYRANSEDTAGHWLFGRFSIADAMYAPVVLRFRTYGINLPESASAYPQRLLESVAMQEWLSAAESELEVIDDGEVGQ